MWKTWKFTLWKVRSVNDALRHFSFRHSLSTRTSDCVKLFDLHVETSISASPPTTSSSSSSTSASVIASASHTSSTSRSGSPTGHGSPLLTTLFSGASRGKRDTGTTVTVTPTTDSVTAWDEMMSSSRMTLLSERFAFKFEEHGSYIVDLKYFSLTSYFLKF